MKPGRSWTAEKKRPVTLVYFTCPCERTLHKTFANLRSVSTETVKLSIIAPTVFIAVLQHGITLQPRSDHKCCGLFSSIVTRIIDYNTGENILSSFFLWTDVDSSILTRKFSCDVQVQKRKDAHSNKWPVM